MALDTVTRRLERAGAALARTWRRPRRASFSRVAIGIFLIYGVSFVILVAFMAVITESRRGLVDAKIVSLRDQAEVLANVLAETAVPDDSPEPALDPDAAREVLTRLRALYVPDETRAVVYTPGLRQAADSDLIAGEIEERPLPPPGAEVDTGFERGPMARAEAWFGGLFASGERRALIDRSLEEEVAAAFSTGDPQAGLRRAASGARIVSVTVPIQPIQAVIGTVTYESYDLEAIIAAERSTLLPYIAIAALVLGVGATLLTLYIAGPIRRLAQAADQVRLAGGRRVDLPDFSRRKDEIGELGRAFTAMTTALYDRLDAIESFAADVSHEIKNPLTSIRSAAEILPLAKDDERRARLISVIQHDVRRLDRLVTDISNASRLDAELAREDLARIDLERMLSDLCAAQMGDGETPARAEVRLHADGDLTVRGHEGPLSRVFINLIENAVTFSPEGGVVRVRARRMAGPHGRVVVTVEDEGPGIPAENLETIFDRFYTERPAGAAFGGHSGLGLAIARQIVTAHGGQIRAENRSGPDVHGACFTVVLPAAARPRG
jgi:two-component system sensor histidine kinase ChvG